LEPVNRSRARKLKLKSAHCWRLYADCGAVCSRWRDQRGDAAD